MSPEGDFALQYLEKHIPGYAAPSKWLTERHTSLSLDYREVASMIRLGQIRMDLPSISIGAFLAPYSKRVFSTLPRMTPEDALKNIQMLDASPLGRMAMMMVRPHRKKLKDGRD